MIRRELAGLERPFAALPGVDLTGMQPDTLARFTAMAREYRQTTGKTIQVNSAYRSREKQAALYAADPVKNAAPGRSMHNYGHAIDIQSEDANRLDAAGLLKKYGFHRPLMAPTVRNREPWHIETRGLNYAKIRAAGIPTAAALLAAMVVVYLLTRKVVLS